MGKIKPIALFNYFFIALVLLWSPLQGSILTFDGKGRIILLLTLLTFVVNCNRVSFYKLLFSKPIVFWFIWCIYATINTYIHGYNDTETGFIFFAVNQIFCPCMIMAVSAYEYTKNSNLFLKVVLSIYLIYAFLGTFIMDIGYLSQDVVDKNTLGNALALNVVMIIFYAGVLYCKKEIKLKTTIVLILLAIVIVVISATRKAFGASAIMVVALILSQIKLSFKSFVKIIIPVIILYYGLGFVMNNTEMGERIGSLEETSENMNEHYNIGDNYFLKAMGDRAPHYILGYELFKKNPITGIGLKNFQQESGYSYRLHTEYMVQVCECGIIGCILFLSFNISILKRLIRRIKFGPIDKRNSIMMLGTMGALFFIYLTTWSYSISTYFAVLGTIVGYTFSNKQVK